MVVRLLRCPHCGIVLDGAINVDGRTEPREWSPMLCPNCAVISTFDYAADGGLRPATREDWDTWKQDRSLRGKIRTALVAAALMRKDTDNDQTSNPLES